jgi:hypothetical protein
MATLGRGLQICWPVKEVDPRAMEWLILIGVLVVVFGALGAWVATQKRRGASDGLAMGLVFGPLDVLVEALLPQGAGGSGGSPAVSPSRRNIDDLGVIEAMADRFRTTLDETDPNWE